MSKIWTISNDKSLSSDLSRVFLQPCARRALRRDEFWRRGVPVFLVSFLCLLAIIRFMSLVEQHGSIELETQRDLRIAARFLEAESLALSLSETDTPAIDELLTSRLPDELLQDGRFVVVSSSDGVIQSTTPTYEFLIGSNLVSKLSLSPSAIQIGRGETAVPGIFDENAIVTTSVDLAGGLGLATIVQIESVAFASWRKSLAVNVSLFTFTSLVLLGIVLGYFQQAARAAGIEDDYNETHELVETALNLGHSGLWNWNVSRGDLQLSASLYELLGLSPVEGAIGFPEIEKRLHPSDLWVKNHIYRVVAGNLQSFDQTFRLRHRDGHYLWLRARAEATSKSNGERHLVGIIVDVSEQQALTERTQEAHHQLHSAIENIPETFVLYDSDDRIVLANSRYRAVFGLTEEDTRSGTHLYDVVRKSRKPIGGSAISGSITRDSESASEINMPDGRWLLLSERRTGDGYISIGADITQLKMHQSRLRESEGRLTDIIHTLSETKKDLTRKANQLEDLNLNFRAEKNRAEAASRAKSTFLANMSHELRTPLNAILGFSDIMRHGLLGPLGSDKYTGYANDIFESGTFLLQLIDDILDMQRIESGRTTIVPHAFDLCEAVEETARMVEASSAKRGINITIERPESVTLVADRRMIAQILINLMTNAAKFSDPGGEVRVCVKERANAVLLSITDRGEGISAKNLEKIGRPFEQTESEWTRTKKGTGLGLAISRSLTELHHGRFRIASTLGEGTIVSIRLPKDTAHAGGVA
ncbi:ATP-binding protein [Fulvimarina sp. 2208YS6-2-32]|uniref:histidine kinase n=1 Tax=Fulvimarina uroteuthidis TaxID=3098149 RepID=A0ABU5HX26_9HYPH|nr:ATP-binding protein [Fulvimarina sp. 2208YS6-2-32]MDY8107685.1 ATP-binding protein [Fulvimarina sp. 2208YS6-2-32]